MSEATPSLSSVWITRGTLSLLLVGLIALSYLVLSLFLAPIAWAFVLAYVTWPVYRRLRKMLRDRATLSAFLMTIIAASVFVVPILWLIVLMHNEVVKVYASAETYFSHETPSIAETLFKVPWVGEQLRDFFTRYVNDTNAPNLPLSEWIQSSMRQIVLVLSSVGRNLGKLILSFTIVFFLYRDGSDIRGQIESVLRRTAGEKLDHYISVGGETARAVVYGLMATAVIQGTMAAIGYKIVGMNAPILLGALTAIVSVVPVFGTLLVWGSVSIWLFLNGLTWQSLVMVSWGTVLVHPVDNLMRPLLISNVAHIPFLVVMLGVLGGLTGFGLVGVFVGPVVLAIGVAVWREWVKFSQTIDPVSH